MRANWVVLLGLILGAAMAAPPDEAPPPLPTAPVPDEGLEPEVTIVLRKDMTVHEYRVNGRLYMVRIVPRRGKPYYLVDQDGDGEMETRRFELDTKLLIPSWVLLRW